jgi:hypothetical protein
MVELSPCYRRNCLPLEFAPSKFDLVQLWRRPSPNMYWSVYTPDHILIQNAQVFHINILFPNGGSRRELESKMCEVLVVTCSYRQNNREVRRHPHGIREV